MEAFQRITNFVTRCKRFFYIRSRALSIAPRSGLFPGSSQESSIDRLQLSYQAAFVLPSPSMAQNHNTAFAAPAEKGEPEYQTKERNR